MRTLMSLAIATAGCNLIFGIEEGLPAGGGGVGATGAGGTAGQVPGGAPPGGGGALEKEEPAAIREAERKLVAPAAA